MSFNLRSLTILFSLLVAAVAVYLANRSGSHEQIIFSSGTSFPTPPMVYPLSDEQRATFRETGVLFIPGLLKGDMLQDAIDAAEHVFETPNLLSFMFRSVYAKLTMQEWRRTPGLARVAFESSMSSITADLLGESKSIRLLKDAVFGQTGTGIGCGFHVDDKGFWPAEDDSTGINFWVALSEYNAATGGGIRVAPGSHTAEWALACRKVIENSTERTCRMTELSPECDTKIKSISIVYDMLPGDAILWDRWIFHRQEPFRENMTNVHKLRYTVRYVPSNARAAVKGMLMHPSVELGQPFNSSYHPQVWPTALQNEMESLQKGLDPDISIWLLLNIAKRVMMRKLLG